MRKPRRKTSGAFWRIVQSRVFAQLWLVLQALLAFLPILSTLMGLLARVAYNLLFVAVSGITFVLFSVISVYMHFYWTRSPLPPDLGVRSMGQVIQLFGAATFPLKVWLMGHAFLVFMGSGMVATLLMQGAHASLQLLSLPFLAMLCVFVAVFGMSMHFNPAYRAIAKAWRLPGLAGR